MKLSRKGLNPWLGMSSFWHDNELFIQELKYFPRLTALAISTSLLVSILDGVGIGLLLSFLQSLIQTDVQPLNTGIDWLDVWVLGVHASPENRILRLSVLILVITGFRSVLLYFSSIYSGVVSVALLERLRLKIFDQLQGLSLSYFTRTRSGELVNALTVELNKLTTPLLLLGSLVKNIFAIAIYSIALFLISWQLSVISVLLLALLSVGLSTLRKTVREASFDISKANETFTSAALEFINGIFTVHAYNGLGLEQRRIQQASAEIAQATTRAIIGSSLVPPISTGVGSTILIGLTVSGVLILHMPIAALLTFIYALLRLIPVLQDIHRIVTQMSFFQGSIESVKELLRSDNKPQFQNGSRIYSGLKEKIQLVALDFSYGESGQVLNTIHLDIQKGQTTALVGASGSGKTTLAALLMRFYDPQRGQILIDGVDLRELEITSLRRTMALVSQDPFIFHASVKENIMYGTETMDPDRLWQSAQLANALEFILELPQGFDTLLGDRGVKLSGGQRQRLAIARALYRDPEILILDEATSALDSESEHLIQAALEQLKLNRTVIAIAHRLSTIAKADQVVVLEAGQIVEKDSYQALINQKGRLWQYHNLQSTAPL